MIIIARRVRLRLWRLQLGLRVRGGWRGQGSGMWLVRREFCRCRRRYLRHEGGIKNDWEKCLRRHTLAGWDMTGHETKQKWNDADCY
jgi:hypothetical protein